MDTGTRIICVLLLVFLFLSISGYIYVDRQSRYDMDRIRIAGELHLLAQNIPLNTVQTLRSYRETHATFRGSINLFDMNLQHLQSLQAGRYLLSPTMMPEPVLDSVTGYWQIMAKHAQVILNEEQSSFVLTELFDSVQHHFPALLVLSDRIISHMIEAGVSPKNIYLANRQLILISRLLINASEYMDAHTHPAATNTDIARQLKNDITQLGLILDAMYNGNRSMNIERSTQADIRASLAEAISLSRDFNDTITRLLDSTTGLYRTHHAGQAIIRGTPELRQRIGTLLDSYKLQAQTRPVDSLIVLILSVVTMGFALLLLVRVWGASRVAPTFPRQLPVHQQTTQVHNGQIISRPADHDTMIRHPGGTDSNLSTVDASMIPLDYPSTRISELKSMSEQIASTAHSSQATALQLAEAGDQESVHIDSLVTALGEIAQLAESMSAASDRSATLTDNTITLTQSAGHAVQGACNDLNAILDQTKLAKRRLKHPGDGSQDINKMVEVINNTLEQINILVLNAALQASSSGATGHGFALLAEEVQHLIDKSSTAIHKIGALVSSLHADSDEAVISLEQSTARIMEGISGYQTAAGALRELEHAAQQLNELLQSLSATARRQSIITSGLPQDTNPLQNGNARLRADCHENTSSLGRLVELANQLQQSVADFRMNGHSD